jgi:hypothetical protein
VRFEVDPENRFCAGRRSGSKSMGFDSGEGLFWRYVGEAEPSREMHSEETVKQTSKSSAAKDKLEESVDLSIREGHDALQRALQKLADTAFDEAVGYQKQKITEKMFKVNEEISYLNNLRVFSILGYSLQGNSCEKTFREKVLEEVSFCWVSVSQVCAFVYPVEAMGVDEKRRALNRIRMQLLRLAGGKKKRGRGKGKLVQCQKIKGVNYYLITLEGGIRLHFYHEERIKAGNDVVLNERLRAIMGAVKELASEIEQLQTLNNEAVKRLFHSAGVDYVVQTMDTSIRAFTRQLIEEVEGIMESNSASRFSSFARVTNEVLNLGVTEISISDRLHLFREMQKLSEN